MAFVVGPSEVVRSTQPCSQTRHTCCWEGVYSLIDITFSFGSLPLAHYGRSKCNRPSSKGLLSNVTSWICSTDPVCRPLYRDQLSYAPPVGRSAFRFRCKRPPSTHLLSKVTSWISFHGSRSHEPLYPHLLRLLPAGVLV